MMVKQVKTSLKYDHLVCFKYYLCATWRQNKAVQPMKVLALQAVYIRYLCGPTGTIFDFSSSYAGHPHVILAQSIICITFSLLK